ncbi:transcription factor bHLH143-like [Andrographis paniculata]|uniref:transcription factor bHLH143-like n=1 Tax=Andrographis paniculata TaxID=175694 RepID=UPI0021E91DE1|nr:transcription factor bHLH143-like [Andrographis paniculata]
MEKDFRFGFHNQQLHLSLPNLNSSHSPFDMGCSNAGPVLTDPNSAKDSLVRAAPLFPVSQFRQSRVCELNDTQNRLFHVPDLYKTLNAAPKENLLTGLFESGQRAAPASTGIAHNRKQFLVFDHSGHKTTLIYSSGVQTLSECGAKGTENPPTSYIFSKDPERIRGDLWRANTADESIGDDDESRNEMQEDTEELNALLCSDGNSDFTSDDNEEASTGHSPSSMTDNGVHDPVEESETGEEVDSLVVTPQSKRQKLLDGGEGYGEWEDRDSWKRSMPSLEDEKEELESWQSGKKRWRKERIRETLSILQRLIPNPSVNNGKGAVYVIDEAIRYLKSLKAESGALGLDDDSLVGAESESSLHL